MRDNPLNGRLHRAYRHGQKYDVGPFYSDRGVRGGPVHHTQRDGLRTMVRIFVGSTNLSGQTAGATSQPHTCTDQAQANDRKSLYEW
jgi:hypothetical protein